MNNIQKRFILFIFGCILVRSLFVIIAKKINKDYLPFLGYLALLPVIGWIYILVSKSRQIGMETFGEKIWWNKLRYLHASLYLIFAILAINKYDKAYIVLLIDVLIGLVSFLIYHYNQGNYRRLISL